MEWWHYFLIGIFIVALYGVYLGFDDEAVFYMNEEDVLISFLPLVAGVASLALIGIPSVFFGWHWLANISGYIAGFVLMAGIFYTFYLSYIHNKGDLKLSIPIACAKNILVLIIWYQFSEATRTEKLDNESNAEFLAKKIQAAGILAGIATMMGFLVNGERVYSKNGWLEDGLYL